MLVLISQIAFCQRDLRCQPELLVGSSAMNVMRYRQRCWPICLLVVCSCWRLVEGNLCIDWRDVRGSIVSFFLQRLSVMGRQGVLPYDLLACGSVVFLIVSFQT